ncbi:LacI family DNA-binding transcriptional regulator [Dongshaea marina]|uniref:LacI family DNA-binding transcriptional regulator n=1 Tax=Dongshaea marina TaxID=2047966 RepID=UPI000D3E1C05|nr:LacI family DNA-binding transcriptional regulator [Dongshaea marina]
MITLEDVATHAGVSRATVSRVINRDSKVRDKTRLKIERSIAELGYAPNPSARSLASRQSQTLGLVTTSYLGGFFGMLMDNVQNEANRHYKQLLVTQGGGSEANELTAIRKLYNLNCDGLILHVRSISDEKLLALADEEYSFILLDRQVTGLEHRCVAFDHQKASQMATQSLLKAGHRHIACISGPQSRTSSQQRTQGFIDAMQQAGLEPAAHQFGEYDLLSGYDACCRILEQGTEMTALYCCNEEMAVGALLAIAKAGLTIPGDISLICYDSGERAAFVSPKLTSVHFPIAAMAKTATELLINPQSKRTHYEPTIIDRGSVASI